MTCPRLTEELDRLSRQYTHLDEQTLTRWAADHCCPLCSGWTPTAHLPRDPEQARRTP